MDRTVLANAALGKEPIDVLIRGGKLVNVYTGEIYPADVAIKGDSIAYVGDCSGLLLERAEVIDAKGMYLCPGLIDQHVHTYESHLNIVEFANAVMPLGVTGIVTDFYGECVVGGVPAVRNAIEIAKRQTPLKIFLALPMPAYYQNKPFEFNGHPNAEEMTEMMDWPECVGLNDSFGSKMIAGDPDMRLVVDQAQKRRLQVCGHGSELDEAQSNAWMAYIRRTDDHECVSAEELLYKLRAGMYVSMRIGSGCVNLPKLAPALAEHRIDTRRITMNTDVASPLRISEHGHLDNCVRTAIRCGVPPVDAIRMATLNTAECVRIDDLYGAVAPGKIADILLVEDLTDFRPAAVLSNGRLIAKNGTLLKRFESVPYPREARSTVRFPRRIRSEDFQIPAKDGAHTVRVVGCSDGTIITGELEAVLTASGGELRCDPGADVLKAASIERTGGKGELFTGFVKGFGLKKGAIASTYNPHNQHMMIVGADEADMALAANTLRECGGGFAVCCNGEVKAKLPLPLYGLLSDRPLEEVIQGVKAVYTAAWECGCTLSEPLHTLAFMGLPVIIGTLKISPFGLVDVWKEAYVDLIKD